MVEVVSPGERQRDRDYIAKRRQYGNRDIPDRDSLWYHAQ